MTTDTKAKFIKILKHFTLQEICKSAIFYFPETNIFELQKLIKRDNDVMSKKNIILKLLCLVGELTVEELNSRFSKLLLLAVSKSQTKTWTAFMLKAKTPINLERDALSELKRSLNTHGLKADVDMITSEGKNIFSVVKKTKGRGGVRRQNPIFFQCYFNEPYLFCGRASLNNAVLQRVVNGLGYDMFRKCDLSGPKVLDLLRMLRNKVSKNHNAQFLAAEPELSHEVKITPGRTDYSQYSNRNKYAEEIFGADPPLLQTLKIVIKEGYWRPNQGFEEMETESMKDILVTMTASNSLEYIKELITNGIITEPVPSYLKAIITSGKNYIKISN